MSSRPTTASSSPNAPTQTGRIRLPKPFEIFNLFDTLFCSMPFRNLELHLIKPQVSSPWEWEREIYRTGGKAAIEDLLAIHRKEAEIRRKMQEEKEAKLKAIEILSNSDFERYSQNMRTVAD